MAAPSPRRSSPTAKHSTATPSNAKRLKRAGRWSRSILPSTPSCSNAPTCRPTNRPCSASSGCRCTTCSISSRIFMPASAHEREWDVIVVGSGAAGLSAALAAAVDGAKVIVLEKAPVLGGTTAMSSAGTWVPANHHMLAAGLSDSADETLTYLRATAPPGWAETEDELWQALAENSAPMLRFVEDHAPVRFELVDHPDFYVEAPGGKRFGRMVSPTLISRYRLGRWWHKVRPSVKPQFFTYKEMVGGILKDPWRSVLRMGPALAWRFVAGRVGLGNGLIVGLTRGCFDHGCRIVANAHVKRLLTDAGS